MHWGQLYYFPVPLPIFSILAGLAGLLIILIALRALHYAYARLGISAPAASLLLIATLLGSYINLPVAQLPGQRALSGQIIYVYGMPYVIPTVVDWPGTVIAVNVGGALIPAAMSLYLLVKSRLWGPGLVAIIGVAAVCNWLAKPVPGLGIALPVFTPALAGGLLALLLSRRSAAPLAYIGGSLGALIGADLLNLDAIRGLGAPVASIGGAGTFDGVFLTGIIAVLIASLSRGRAETQRSQPSPEQRRPDG